jgi:ubiquinone/menaquinone biosynthesis C-methylase UbiE
LTKSEEELGLRRVSDRWDRTAQARAVDSLEGWLDSPILLEAHFQPTISGFARKNWLVGLAERLRIPGNGRWLSLGCGTAGQEINAAKARLFSSLVALDGSPESVEEGRRQAAAAGVANIEFGPVNLDRLDLPRSAFDVVLMNMSLHHVRRLRRVLSRVDRALRPAGLFLINEFIGPRQFQFTDLHLRLVRELLDDLPRSLRTERGGEIKTEYVRLPVEHWNRADPSEAIRSDRIVPEVSRRFRIVERIDYGGAILNPLLEKIVHNFDPSDEKDVAVVRLIARFEDVLMRSGVLPSDFTVMAMRRRPGLLRFLRFLPPVWSQGTRRSALRHPALPAGVARSSVVDFREAPHPEALIAGFHHWEGAARWMSRRGELRLRMTSGRLSLLFAAPFQVRRRPAVRMRLLDEASGRTATLDPIRFSGPGPIAATVEIPRRFASAARGRTIHVILESNNVWVPARSLDESTDFRELSIQIIRAGFEPDP